MATVNLTSTITSTNLTSDSLLSTVLKSATVTQGGISRTNVTAVVGAPLTLIPHASHSPGAYVYLKNAGSLNIYVKIEATASGAVYDMFLDAGSWALFPWAADTSDIRVYASGATGCLVEHGVFE